jgi:FkbM family methyltransferase
VTSSESDDRVPVAAISYAQNFEDVRLWKSLSSETNCIYIDIGAGNPTDLSVTRLFSERGWNGINVEPGPNALLLKSERPRDVTLQVAISSSSGEIAFTLRYPHLDLSSIYPDRKTFPDELEERSEIIAVESLTLVELFDRYLEGQEIGFLKVDVEGAEEEVISSNDWSRFRPLVVVVEAIDPSTWEPSYGSWEPVLLAAGYEFAIDDGINRFYARSDRPDLKHSLAQPVSPIDGFFQWPILEAAQKAAIANEIMAAQAQLTVTGLERDKRMKELEVELQASRVELIQRDSQLAAEMHQAIVNQQRVWELEASWAYRIGRVVVVFARPFRPVLLPLANGIRRLRHKHMSRRSNVVAEVARLTAQGEAFERLSTVEDTEIADAPQPFEIEESSMSVATRLRSRRTTGPQLLNEREWELVESLTEDEASATALNELRRFRSMDIASANEADWPKVLLIDTRGAQLSILCGTRTHARNAIEVVLAAVPPNVEVWQLASMDLPPLPDELLTRFDGVWGTHHRRRVGSFLELAPFIPRRTDFQAKLSQSPSVRSAGVWLDAILGTYPRTFLKTDAELLEYQFGLECIGAYGKVLSISESSTREAIESGVRPDRIVNTGCAPGLSRLDESTDRVVGESQTGQRSHVVIVGNWLPHKNVLVGVAGAIPFAVLERTDLDVVVIAGINDDQRTELTTLALKLGLERSRFRIASQISDVEFDSLLRDAEAVIVPSLHEGFSLSVIESLERGTPVVLSAIPAHEELLGSGPWNFSPEDPLDVLRALRDVVANRSEIVGIQTDRYRSNINPLRFEREFVSVTEWLCEDLSTIRTAGGTAESDSENSLLGDRNLSLSKVCEVEDFATPRLRTVIRDVFAHEQLRFGPEFPSGREYRKYWEVAMAVLSFREAGLLDGNHRFLGIGAGNEPTSFYLTRFAEEVIATDLYLADGWEESADSSMLVNPGGHWPFLWDPTRLRVEDMNALALDLPDESVSGVFSSSSIEHFGDRNDVAKSLDEAWRVLRPGGILSISTEFRLEGERPGIPGALLFDQEDVRTIFLGERKWSFVEPFDDSVSPATWGSLSPFLDVAEDQNRQVARLGGLWTHHVTYARYPHILLEHQGRTFTSFHLALRKES